MKEEVTIGIVGGGIVGATAGYYLARDGFSVTLVDEGKGQATSASAGIINPWFSLRRNKPWYHLVAKGAEFYRTFMQDLTKDGYEVSQVFQADGALMIRQNDKRLAKDLNQAEEKRVDSPSIGEVKTVKAQDYFDLLPPDLRATYVEGGAYVDGAALIDVLHQAIQDFGGIIYYEKAVLEPGADAMGIRSENTRKQFDHILLATGAWLPQVLEPLGYCVDVKPQKGQLFSVYNDEWKNQNWPVVMPPGTADIIPLNTGEIIIGATHEDDLGYNLDVDEAKLNELEKEATKLVPEIEGLSYHRIKVGTRAQTSDYSVFIGEVPAMPSVWAVSGLGSSGLTSGPYLGYQWSQYIRTGEWGITLTDYPISNYVVKENTR